MVPTRQARVCFWILLSPSKRHTARRMGLVMLEISDDRRVPRRQNSGETSDVHCRRVPNPKSWDRLVGMAPNLWCLFQHKHTGCVDTVHPFADSCRSTYIPSSCCDRLCRALLEEFAPPLSCKGASDVPMALLQQIDQSQFLYRYARERSRLSLSRKWLQ
jgi:hypothetical protein